MASQKQPSNLQEASNIPKQSMQEQPGLEHELNPRPVVHHLPADDGTFKAYKAAGKLENKVALITGGDSGIGRAVATLFALEGAEGIAIVHLEREEKDARETKERIEKQSKTKVLLISKDVGYEENVVDIVKQVQKEFDHIDILVNNASEQHICEKIEELTSEQLERTFRSNIFGMFYLAKHAVHYMKEGSLKANFEFFSGVSAIINTTSVTAYKGKPNLLDYSSTKGAIVAFTRSLALHLVKRGIRVNAVAPGPIWTPLIAASFPPEQMETFGTEVPMGRPGQPSEVAPTYVFLASNDSTYYTGQVLHPNGGSVVNG